MPELEDQPEPEPLPPSRNQAPRAVYNAEGDAQAALERYHEDFPDDASTDSSGYSSDGDQPRDMYEDGSVVKQRVTTGEGWETPKELCKCDVTYKVWSGTGVDMKTIDDGACTLRIDEGESPLGFFDDVLKTMRKKEVCDVVVKQGCEEGLPQDEDCTVRLTLVDFAKAPVSHEMKDDAERLAHVATLKDNGNAWFKKGDFQRAKRRYESAVYFGEYESDEVKVRGAASAVPSRRRRDSSPSSDEVGGLFFDFEPFRTASGPSRRVGETAVAATASSRDRVAATPSS